MTIWHQKRAGATTPLESSAFWDSFSLWEEYEKHTNYPGPLWRSVAAAVDAHTTILDVGAGTGALAVPLAKIARSVTALEPSAAQMERLIKRLDKAGCENVRFIRKNWEEADLSELGLHDIVIAGYSLFMPDIVTALCKLIEGASRQVVIIHLHSHDLQSPLREIHGDEISAPDMHLLLRILQEMGVKTGVTVHKRTFCLPLELQLNMFRYAQKLSSEQIKSLEDYVRSQGCLFTRGGALWLRRWYRDAVITIDAGRESFKSLKSGSTLRAQPSGAPL